MAAPIARWNHARDVWESASGIDLFSGQPAVWSETFPASGMTRDGSVYELPTWAPRTDGSESSLLPTPTATPYGNNQSPSPGALVRPSIEGIVKLLPTPVVTDSFGARNLTSGRSDPNSKHHSGTTLSDALRLLPTPTAHDAKSSGPSQVDRNSPMLSEVYALLPTPSVADASGGHKTRGGSRSDEMLLPGIAKLIGESTAQRSDAGSASLE